MPGLARARSLVRRARGTWHAAHAPIAGWRCVAGVGGTSRGSPLKPAAAQPTTFPGRHRVAPGGGRERAARLRRVAFDRPRPPGPSAPAGAAMRIQMFLFVSSFALAAGAHAADWRDISFKAPVGERDELVFTGNWAWDHNGFGHLGQGIDAAAFD